MVPRSIRPYEDEFFLWRDSMALQIGLFILTFLFVFVIYELFLVRKAKKNKAKKKPVEVQYLVNRYHIDLKKVNYKKLLNVISFVSSLDIAIVVSHYFISRQYVFTTGTGICHHLYCYIN